MTDTGSYEGMIAETTSIQTPAGETITTYYARPLGPGPFPGVVLIHHMPGWDDWYKEATRTFAARGYLAISPDLYCRVGTGSPEDVAAKARAEGGVADDQVVNDVSACGEFLRGQKTSNGKVAVFGSCSGGRHAMLAASRSSTFDAVVDLWGGGVVMGQDDLSPKRPVAPIDYTADLTCPVLGIFGNDDRSPTHDQVNTHEAALKEHGKQYEFHRYDDAGHGFFYHFRPGYRPVQAVDAWGKVWAFLDQQIGAGA